LLGAFYARLVRKAEVSHCFINDSFSDIADISINEYLMTSASQKRKLAFELLTAELV
jgi:hypothetical protein